MATPHKVIVTAKTGPNRQLTAAQLLNVENVEIDLVGKRLLVEVDQAAIGYPPPQFSPTGDAGDNIKEFDLAGVATVTVAIAAGVWTVTVA